MTNNEAKYEVIFTGLNLAKAAGASLVVLHSDSQVVAGHINKDYETKGKQMKKYLNLIKRQVSQDFAVEFIQVPREENKHADQLAKAISSEHMMIGHQVLSFTQQIPIIEELEILMIPKGVDWTTPIISYLKNGTLLEDCDESQRLKVRAACFVLIVDVLYKRGFSRPYLRCLIPDEADYVIREVHEGVCQNHSSMRSLVHKLI